MEAQTMLTSKQELNSKNTKQDLLTEESSEEAVKERVAKDGKKGCDDNDDDALRRRRRKTRYNSFSSSVYDEDARWKALHEERPDKPCHKSEDSPFSSSSGFHNFRGLLNWCIIILVFTTGRAALENLIKYGVLIDPVHSYRLFVASESNFPMVWVFIALFSSIMITFFVEKVASKFRVPERLISFLHTTTFLFEISFPAIFVFILKPSPFLSSPVLTATCLLFLKLVSYAQVNKWCRLSHRQQPLKHQPQVAHRVSKKHHHRSTSIKAFSGPNYYNEHERFAQLSFYQHYPHNLNIQDLCYFILAPTVCYELNYPRTTRIRARFLLSRALEICFLLGLILSLIQQWIVPTLENSVGLFGKMNYAMMLARILKLAIPNHFIWLISFYFIFHSCSNFNAELLKFADRQFYKDWWNAENLQQFWSTWNIPIHRFALRHVYKPILRKGSTKVVANACVFLMSALFHEYLVSIPLNMLRPWFLVSFLLQTPLVVMSDRMSGKVGNMVVWVLLILGQPLAIMMYYHDYFLLHNNNNTIPSHNNNF